MMDKNWITGGANLHGEELVKIRPAEGKADKSTADELHASAVPQEEAQHPIHCSPLTRRARGSPG